MAHLKGFGLENFRVFKEYTWFDFAPITILVGPNSSGKSSLIKALLLMDDNLRKEKSVSTAELTFTGLLHNLGSYKNIISEGSLKSDISFVLPLVDKEVFSGQIHRLFNFTFSEGRILNFYQENLVLADRTPIYTRREFGKVYLNLPLLISILQNFISKDNQQNNKSNRLLESAIFILKNCSICKNESDFLQEINLWQKYEVDEFYEPLADTLTEEEDEEYEYVKFGRFEFEGKKYQLPTLSPSSTFEDANAIELYLESLYPGNEEIEEVTKSIWVCLTYGTDLKNPQRTKLNLSEQWPNELNYLPSVKGILKRSFQAGDDHALSKLIDGFNAKEIDYKRNLEFLSKWAKAFNLGEIKIDRIDHLNTSFVSINGHPIADVGYGLTQLTALLLTILSNKIVNKNEFFEDNLYKALGFKFNDLIDINNLFETENFKTILLEEPESNLHPKFQSQLAELLNESRNQIDQFIIETHSEYMIRKFQYLVAKGKMKPKDVVIYYFNDPNNIPTGEKQVKKINILEDGSLSDDFGLGFYDEADNLAISLFNLQKSQRN